MLHFNMVHRYKAQMPVLKLPATQFCPHFHAVHPIFMHKALESESLYQM